MIGHLTGKPNLFTPESIIVEVNGIGYQVYVTQKLIQLVADSPPNQLALFTHTYIREDTFDLYGFLSREELHLFKQILSISGIGPKTALHVLDRGVDQVTSAVAKADVDFFTTIPRLGKKNSQKLIIELKPKLGDIQELDLIGESSETKEILSALTGLGFSKREALEALKRVADPGDDIELKLTKAIKYLGKNK